MQKQIQDGKKNNKTKESGKFTLSSEVNHIFFFIIKPTFCIQMTVETQCGYFSGMKKPA